MRPNHLTSFKTIEMNLGKDSYPIVIGENAVEDLPKLINTRRSNKIFMISDRALKSARKKVMKLMTVHGWEIHDIPVKAGEGLKDIQSVYPIYGELLKKGADRDSLILALGGGSIGDVAGFIASTYLRGIDWVGLPTTLLAQVDSSVGGKTGINHSAGKNLIGSFYQPTLVICDVQFLKTLSKREVVSGLGEVVKYSLTFDAPFFHYLDEHLEALLKLQPAALTHAIQKSIEWKCKAVTADVYDRKGVREVLNFGHTFGHALESATKYKKFQHGEAVIWGMRFALALSEKRDHLKAGARLQMDELLQRLPIPKIPKTLKPQQIFDYMKKDKKVEGKAIRFVLIDRVGHSLSDRQVIPSDLKAAHELLSVMPKKPKKKSSKKQNQKKKRAK
jgi:3-dehydroquinate synthase